MSQNNSDYIATDNTSIKDMLDDVYRDPLIDAVSSSVFDRFLTQDETQRVIGTVGRASSASTQSIIPEDTIFDQAYQLQPVIETVVGPETQYYSYQDLLAVCEQTGIDITKVQTWQAGHVFNFGLPITIDKYVNYANYYWIIQTAQPEYVTVKNPQLVLQMQIAQMVNHYMDLYNANDYTRINLWYTIAELLDYMYTQVSARISIANLDIVVTDPIHAPYVQTVRTDPQYNITNDWQTANHWVHRMHVSDITNAQRAQMPIIEYDNTLQMTGWTYTASKWKYRASESGTYQSVTAAPSDDELLRRWFLLAADPVAETFTLSGNATAYFEAGNQFSIEESSSYTGQWTALSVTLDGNGNTVIQIKENIIPGTVDGTVVPFIETSQGDRWVSFYKQWQFDGHLAPKAVIPPANQITPWQGQIVAAQGQTQFILPSGMTYITGENALNVYVDGVRSYGSYLELDSTSIGFYYGLNAGQVVTLVIGAYTARDQSRYSLPVTVQNADGSYGVKPVCLMNYRKNEQFKSERNQYPQFDLVNLDGSPAYKSSSIVSFMEDPAAPIDPVFGRRIVADTVNKDWTMYIGVADGTLQSFIHNDVQSTVWYPKTDLWVPELIDGTGAYTTDGSGVYEMPIQYTNNVHHGLRSKMNFSDLFTHFRSMLLQQPTLDASLYGDIDPMSGSHLQETMDLGVAGYIKEHNGSFDTFISTLISSDHQYGTVLAFARDTYRETLVQLVSTLTDKLVEALQSADPQSIVDLTGYITNAAITAIEGDALLYKLYGDSTIGTKYGSIKNWIATVPFIGCTPPVLPEVLIDPKLNIYEVLHHDGHRGMDEFDTLKVANLIPTIVDTLGLQSTNIVNDPAADVSVGQLHWYKPTNTLYRLGIVAVGTVEPLLADFADNAFWLNRNDNKLYKKINGAWTYFSDTLQPAWIALDLPKMILNCIFNVELELYDSAQQVTQKEFQINPLSGSSPEFTVGRQAMFEDWCKRGGILDPYVGDFDASNPFTWNYSKIPYSLVQPARSDIPTSWDARVFRIYKQVYGTAYPHLRPYSMQGYSFKPLWWDQTYAIYVGATRWQQVMWNNIKNGIVPAGQLLPDGITISTGEPGEAIVWERMSINITQQTTADGYGPGDLLPPWWVPSIPADNIPGIADQVLLNCDPSLLTGISVNRYTFGQNGPYEYQWKNSVDHLYDLMNAYYCVYPVTTIHKTFGEEFTMVNGLNVSTRTNTVYSHNDVVFHGDVDDEGNLILVDGVNQWYTQYFRYINLDTNATNYKEVWKNWTTHLAYNVGSFVVDNTLSVDSMKIDIAPNDYAVSVKTNRHAADEWIDALYITINTNGSRKEMPKGAGRDWKYDISVNCPTTRSVSYYDVKKKQVNCDPDSGIITIQSGSLAAFGWVDGTEVVFDTGMNGVLPTEVDLGVPYYIIALSDTTFQLAKSQAEAFSHNRMRLGSAESGVVYIGQLKSTFFAFDQQATTQQWNHFEVSSTVLSFIDTVTVTGVQNLIDVSDGYQQYLLDQGFVFNDSSTIEYDPGNNRQLSWQYEIERVITTLYRAAISTSVNLSVKDAVGMLDINPFRNNLWINHPQGVISSFDAVDASQSSFRAIVYNKNQEIVSTKNYHVLREDTQTHMAVVDPMTFVNGIISNDFATIQYLTNSFGGAHIYFDQYEHIVVFSDVAISGDLIYDAFLGIQVPNLSVYFEKQIGNTKRPNIGGYVYGENGSMGQNMEYTVSNITKYYDTFTVNENSNFVNYARAMLGYTPNQSYMTDIGATPKSQFVFYKGLIQNKGTPGSITAFTNNSSLNAASIDEFWAYRSHEFGQNSIKASYLVNLFPTDTNRNQLKLEFVAGNDVPEQFFIPITATDSTRWDEYPNQRTTITAQSNVSFELKIDGIDTFLAANLLPPLNGLTNHYTKHAPATAVQVVCTTIQRTTFTNVANEIITLPWIYAVGTSSLVVYLNGTLTTNFVELANNRVEVPGSLNGTVIVSRKRCTLTEGVHYTRINNRIEMFVGTYWTMGDYTVVRYSPNIERSVPISLMDVKSKTTIADMTTWDPLNGYNTDAVSLTVDTFQFTDPAKYNTIADASRVDNQHFWDEREVGTVWADTSSYKFIQYDDNVTQDAATRLLNWGRLEDWSNPTVYTWIKTQTPASLWTDGNPYAEVYQRSRPTGTLTSTAGVVHITGFTPVTQDEVIILNPTTNALKVETIYYLVTNGAGFSIVDSNQNIIILPDTFTATVMPAAFAGNWTTVRKHQAVLESAEINFTTGLCPAVFDGAYEYAVYVDGVFTEDGYSNDDGSLTLTIDSLQEMLGDANYQKYQVTINTKTGIDGLSTTVPDPYELTGLTTQEYVDYPMVVRDYYNEASGINEYVYYYWVANSSILVGSEQITTAKVQSYLATYTKPYVVFGKPVTRDDVPALSQLTVVGISGLVTDSDRFVLRLVRDDTLRDQTFLDGNGHLLRPIHTEWRMFRQQQDTKVDSRLWNKVIESLVGYKLADPSIPVPALDRVVYDNLNGTNTRYGFDVGQSFVDPQQAIATIYAVLNDPTIDYSPNDMDLFLQTYSMATVPKTVEFMDTLYQTFTAAQVNRVFFAIMLDALAIVGANYATGIIKTSAIAVTSSMPLNVNGAYDGE